MQVSMKNIVVEFTHLYIPCGKDFRATQLIWLPKNLEGLYRVVRQ